jgi:hypothetical protein
MSGRRVASVLVLALAVTGCGRSVSLPDSFPAIEELAERSSPYLVPDLDARIESSLEIVGPVDQLPEGQPTGSRWVITYYDDMTVYDYSEDYREVQIGGRYLYQTPDGTWLESDAFEWSPMSPIVDWFQAQSMAEACLQMGVEQLGAAEVAGVITMHVRCSEDSGAIDLWLDESGRAMKLTTSSGPEGFGVEMKWIVTDLDVAPEPPLP